MNTELYPWLSDLSSQAAVAAIAKARELYQKRGAVVLPHFVRDEIISQCVAKSDIDKAYTTDASHTPYLRSVDTKSHPQSSIYNHEMRTRVSSIPFDDAPKALSDLYFDPRLLRLVALITSGGGGEARKLHHSADPLGCCSINVFRPSDYHSFHFDESEFSTTLMLQEAETGGLFQHTDPLRQDPDQDLATQAVAHTIHAYDRERCPPDAFAELDDSAIGGPPPPLHTLDFRPGTLSILAGSRSLHRVTECHGTKSRLVAVLTFAKEPGFCNSAAVQRMFWGRSAQPMQDLAATKAQETTT